MVNPEIWLNILKSSPIPIAVFELADKSNSLFFANDSYCGFFGVLEGDIANKSVSEIFLAKSIHLKDDVTFDLIKSLQTTVESGEPDKVKNVILSALYPDRAIPETLSFDIEHTPIKEEGVVKYVSQSLLQNKQAPDVSFPDIEKGTEQLSRAELIEIILQNLPIGVAVNRETLAEFENNLLISNTEESFVLLNRDLKIVSFNNQFQQLYKNYFNKIVEKGHSILDYAQPERRTIVAGIYEKVLQGESHISELIVTNPLSDEKTTFSIKFKPAKNSEDEIIGVFVTGIDITERQLALDKLTESEERYKLLFQSSPLPNFVYDLANFQILDVNDRAVEHYGYTRSELLAKSFLDITAEQERKRVIEINKNVQIVGQGANLGIFIQLKKDGGEIKADVSGYKINFGGRDCMMITCNDVTEREKAYQRIKENESKLLASQKIAKVGYWQSFPGSKKLYWSDEVFSIWGVDKETFNLNYETYFNTIHPDDREEFLRSREKAVKEDIQHDVEHRIILPDRSIKWVHALGNVIKNNQDQNLVFEGTVQDITQDKLALDKLLVSEARHRGIFESLTNYMIRTDLEGNYSFVNSKFQQDFGWLYEGKEIIGQNCTSSIVEYHHERVAETVAKCFAELNKVFQVFIDKPRKDGKGVVTTLWDFICLTDSKGQPSEMQCVGIDVSEWKRAQEELEESNARYEYVTRATSDAIWDWDLRTDEMYRGKGFQTLFGYPYEESGHLGSFWEEHIHPEDLKNVLRNIDTVINENQETWMLEYRFKKSNGKYVFIQDKGILIRDKSGIPIKMVGAMQDISENKIAEKQKLLHAETSRLFNQPDTLLSDILEQVLQHILNYGDIAVAELWLPSSDKREINLSSRFTKGKKFDLFYEESFEYKRFVSGTGLPGKVWESLEVELWDEIDIDPRFIRHAAAKNAALKRAVGLPLIYNTEFIGVLVICLQENGENLLEHVAFRDSFCQHLSSEIKRKQLDQELKQIFSFAPDVISVASTDGFFRKINPAACEMLEYSEEELLSKPLADFVHPDDQNKTGQAVQSMLTSTDTFYFENRYITKSGKVLWLAWTSTPSPEEGLIFAVAKNITEKKNLEVLLEKSNSLAEIGSWEIDVQKNTLYWSLVTKQIHEVHADFEADVETFINFYTEGYSRDSIRNAVEHSLNYGTAWDMELEIVTAKANKRWVRVLGEAEFVNGICVKLYGSFQNITNRKVAELELLKIYDEKNTILESIQDGFFAVDKNWIVTYWNREAEKLLDVTKKKTLGNSLWKVFDSMTESTSYSKYHEAIDTNQVIHFVDYYPFLNKWYEVSAYPSVDGLSVFFKDITERKIYDIQVRELNGVLKTKVKELAVSNRELEQFAYVASHDLQEPLRMISSFLTQLQRKYDDQLDAKAHRYIHFAVDGAKRMRQIILDLLDFSRVGRGDIEKELVDLNEVTNEILILFRKNIEETKALFVIGDLPSINVPKASFRQLMQNLVSNALKYQSEGKSPLVEIGFTDKSDYYEFWVKDNGIGISSDYFDKIFIIFQRLHTKDQFSGTGMGLAICRKIVENLGGKLWLESEEDKGSTFYFTIPKVAISVKESQI